RLTHGARTIYARDDADLEHLLKSEFKANAKVDVSRFKGLGEMPPAQLKTTTMAHATRTLLQVRIDADSEIPTARRVEDLMGRNPEKRMQFIREHGGDVDELDI
ncbi:MAG: DNA topoisomerase IV subunit B, partial [Alphaproteobacteria bacterium]